DRTRFVGGIDLSKIKIARSSYILQILDLGGQWRDWGPIHASGKTVGRSRSSGEFPGLSSMAVKHMKFRYDRPTLVVDDAGSLNGFYYRVTEPVQLVDGMRFRIGLQTIEFHEVQPPEPVPPAVGDDGEEFCRRDLVPLAFLDMIRPDGRPGL